jgi:hypothetical protein
MFSNNHEGFTWSFVFSRKLRILTPLSTQVINGKAGRTLLPLSGNAPTYEIAARRSFAFRDLAHVGLPRGELDSLGELDRIKEGIRNAPIVFNLLHFQLSRRACLDIFPRDMQRRCTQRLSEENAWGKTT